MKLEEAIDSLTNNYHWHFNRITDKEKMAVELGVEALRREWYNRQNFPHILFGLLPGETKD